VQEVELFQGRIGILDKSCTSDIGGKHQCFAHIILCKSSNSRWTANNIPCGSVLSNLALDHIYSPGTTTLFKPLVYQGYSECHVC